MFYDESTLVVANRPDPSSNLGERDPNTRVLPCGQLINYVSKAEKQPRPKKQGLHPIHLIRSV